MTTSPDPLDAAVRSLRPQRAFFYRSEVAAPWALSVAGGPLSFHYAEAGTCWVGVGGGHLRLAAGDLVVLPRGPAHTLADSPGRPARPIEGVYERHAPDPDGVLRLPGPGAQARLVCGGATWDPGVPHPLLSALPEVVHVPRTAAVAWLPQTLDFLACEARSGRPGAAAVIGHLVSVVIVQAVRHALGACRTGGLAALRDPHLAPALRALYEAPGTTWTVGTLAREGGLGRSAFAARFRALVGEPPMQHLARWRAYQAGALLREGALTLADVAARVGYESEAAFSRAFKRWTGASPGAFRAGAAPESKGRRPPEALLEGPAAPPALLGNAPPRPILAAPHPPRS